MTEFPPHKKTSIIYLKTKTEHKNVFKEIVKKNTFFDIIWHPQGILPTHCSILNICPDKTRVRQVWMQLEMFFHFNRSSFCNLQPLTHGVQIQAKNVHFIPTSVLANRLPIFFEIYCSQFFLWIHSSFWIKLSLFLENH